ncbi:MAG TPA: phosphate starvation-inducible protein PhoH [Elusimicrobia bacterium]|nr:MAG: phosphate starvation-inducible protein PhoH [Elusimicrobia bacterium RIFOXYA12_FULL_49_49]OGS10322.1 MAG: phosphate starvation-inducible protein PhoH [Elusimicrobia bacterium RIFOXYA1_FULL_47_7]OGS11101.1 MAG: phosphate starvation-inducible protein PhoH [Elusimicrobia bacterium RIFOXYB1_FULL_48_9]OGS16097.1 MAG: phosphate starvation-inducible protein PhoH [Elusimicrobia bacterium RIFOXYA2_FULL_47_53]OGS26723.1 MAG: phosphate starvation-inducible protein PhoH [Elusimicrobia bacterium RIF
MKTFVLDTNVLIHDPESIHSFGNNKVVIPMAVIEELDGFKHLNDERGRSARLVSRMLDALRTKGRLFEGVKLKGGGTLVIELQYQTDLPNGFMTSQVDHRLLGIALLLQKKGEKVFFITKDINLRIKAEAIGLEAQDYEKSKVKVEELYTGWREVPVAGKMIDTFYKDQKLVLKDMPFFPNEGVLLKDEANASKSALAKYNSQKKALIPLFHLNSVPWGLKAHNTEQRFAIELLLCNDVSLVTLIGVPGAGKTLLSLACGLQKTVEEKQFRRLFIARPIIPVGRDIGYLPGSKEEKLTSWMGAIHDNLEYLIDHTHPDEKTEEKIQYFFETGKIEIESLTYIRGRSLPSQYIIIDDAQNLTPHEIKTIISRAGDGTKIILTGDPYQIDNPYLDASSNGLTYLVERFKGQDIFGHLTFTKSERSSLAAMASELL